MSALPADDPEALRIEIDKCHCLIPHPTSLKAGRRGRRDEALPGRWTAKICIQLFAISAHPPNPLAGNTCHHCEGRHVPRDHRTGGNEAILTRDVPEHDRRISTDRRVSLDGRRAKLKPIPRAWYIRGVTARPPLLCASQFPASDKRTEDGQTGAYYRR